MNIPTSNGNDNAKQPDSPEKEDAAPKYSSNADLRVPDNDDAEDAAMSPTGLDIDNDHADQRPVDRSQDAPDASNREQEDESAQAQTAAGDATPSQAVEQIEPQESEDGAQPNPAQLGADDEPDLADEMEQIASSEKIDTEAYRGERNADDETGMLGEGGMDLGDLDEHGNPRRGSDEQNVPVE